LLLQPHYRQEDQVQAVMMDAAAAAAVLLFV